MNVELLHFRGLSERPDRRRSAESPGVRVRLPAQSPRGDHARGRRTARFPRFANDLGGRGRPFGGGQEPIGLSCRIYETPAGPAGRPTDQQLRQAMTLRPPVDAGDLVRTAAFRLLATRSEAVAPATLAEATGIKPERLAEVLDRLDSVGRIRRDADSHVVGLAGLSVAADRHQIDLYGRRFWTWCAYDILGIFGAFSASGRAVSPSPLGGKPIEVAFVRGQPQRDDVVLFRPAAGP